MELKGYRSFVLGGGEDEPRPPIGKWPNFP